MVGVESQDSQAGLSLQEPCSPLYCCLPKSSFHFGDFCVTASEYKDFLKQLLYFLDLQGNFFFFLISFLIGLWILNLCGRCSIFPWARVRHRERLVPIDHEANSPIRGC